jgi:energy-coupling factor transport system ATP-binding protein
MIRLVVEQLSFGYNSSALLFDRLNLNLNRGEFAVLAGKNGSGKTTLLRLLAGLLSPVSGRISVDGSTHSNLRGQVGLLFQNPDHQMIASSVEEEIALGMELKGMPPEQMRPVVDDLLRRYHLESEHAKAPEELSGGQKQRVALAAVMAGRPQFLLLDEPDSFLDAPSRRALLDMVRELEGECGILWTTSNLNRLPEADRYLRLEGGNISEMSRDDLIQSALSKRKP